MLSFVLTNVNILLARLLNGISISVISEGYKEGYRESNRGPHIVLSWSPTCGPDPAEIAPSHASFTLCNSVMLKPTERPGKYPSLSDVLIGCGM